MIKQKTEKRSVVFAIGVLVLAIFLFDVQAAIIKYTGRWYPVEQIAFYRNAFGILPHLFVILYASNWRPRRVDFQLAQWKLGLFRGIVLVGAQMCFYYALVHMQLATATTLAFSGPLFITLLSIPMLGHTVGWWRGFAVLFGFVGVVLVLRPGSDAFSPIAALPIGAALFYALASLSARFFNDLDSTAIISVYATIGAIVVTLSLTLVTGHWMPMLKPSHWVLFFAMGMAGGCAVFCLISAYRMADPSTLSPFEYFGIPFSFVLGWVIFNEKPFDTLFPGALLIVGGGLLILWRERRIKAVDSTA